MIPFIDRNSSEIPLWLQEVCSAMGNKENFQKGIQAMKALSGKSHEHLCRVFKKYCNDTPTNYINEIRLNYSANLLSNTNIDILDISLESGFESLSHFYSLFKKNFGVTPLKFRQKQQRGKLYFGNN